MKVEEIEPSRPEPVFVRFAISIEIRSKEELHALLRAAARMTNGHGVQLYDLLLEKWKRSGYGVPEL